MRGPFANLDKPLTRSSLPLSAKKSVSHDFETVRHLALSVAATLISTAKLDRQAFGKGGTTRRATSQKSATVLNASAGETSAAADTLGLAVAKAVTGTKDGAFDGLAERHPQAAA